MSWRDFTLVAIFLVVEIPAFAALQPVVTNDDPAVLRKRIEELEARVATLEAELKSARHPAPHVADAPPEALSKIVLPDNPDVDAVSDYIVSIAGASSGQQVFSPSDPQVGMLVKVGRKHLPTLIEVGRTSAPFYVIEAVKRLATDEDKQLVIDALPEFPDLASVVMSKKWTLEARDSLLIIARGGSGYVPPSVIQALASLRDPSTYPDLIAVFVSNPGKPMTYQYLSVIPGLELDDAVARAWEVTKETSPKGDWERFGVALIASRHGRLDALEELVNWIKSGGGANVDMQSRTQLLALLPQGVTLAGAGEWIEKNRDSIEWNASVRRFGLRGK